MAGHQLSSQCTARSKRSGQRCRHIVIGGGVCHLHGGKAPAVAAAREARIIAGMAALEGRDDVPRDPAEALLSAAADADAILTRIKRSIAAGEPLTPAQLSTLGDWIDRAARVSKLVVDARISERRVQLETAQLQMVRVAVGRAIGAVGLDAGQRARFLRVLASELRAEFEAGERRESMRLLPPPPEPGSESDE